MPTCINITDHGCGGKLTAMENFLLPPRMGQFLVCLAIARPATVTTLIPLVFIRSQFLFLLLSQGRLKYAKTEMNIAELENGIYFIELRREGKIITVQKLIKQ